MNWLLSSSYILYLVSKFGTVVGYDPTPRWGQATVLVNNALYVHGGKTDPANSYGYSAAPTNNDLLRLSLSTSFTAASPPWQILINSSSVASPQGPALAWHTLSALDTSHALLFGGLPGPNSPTVLVTLADSSYLLDLSDQSKTQWTSEDVSWANQPVRRVYHSTATDASGRVYIIGGEMGDGSNNVLLDHYLFQPRIPSFTILPVENGPPDLVGHASVILPDGRLLVLGGYSQSQGSFIPMSTIWTLNTRQNPVTWTLLQSSNSSLPAPRRSFAATSLGNGNVLIHGGGSTLQENFADGWILNTSQNPMAWQPVGTLSQLGSRRDHFAVSSGAQVLFGFGYDDDSPAPSSLQIYDYVKDAFVSTYNPPPSLASPSPSSKTPRPTKTLSSGGSTGSATGPSGTTGPNNSSPRGRKKTAIAVGVTLGILAFIIITVAAIYYVKRRRLVARGRFMALEDGEDGRNSPHFEGGPVAIPFDNGEYYNHRPVWHARVLGSLSGIMGGGPTRDVRERRDMLADEDAWEFSAWYARSRLDGSNGSSWSLKNILHPRKGSREPTTGSRREKTDSSTRTSVLPRDDERAYQNTTHHPDAKNYTDPFADPIEKERDPYEEAPSSLGPPYLHPLPQPLTTIRAVPSTAREGPTLGTLSERTSQNTLSAHEHPSIDLSHGSTSNLTSHTFWEPSRLSPSGLTLSIVETRPLSELVRRSDSWWTRFSRTSFLDRKLSNASRASGGISEFRDPNPPPRLIPIDESTPADDPSTSHYGSSISRSLSAVYENHNKSKTSVGTADTEAIEKMARIADVQVMRSRSQRTASTDTRSLHIHTRSSSLFGDLREATPVDERYINPFEDPELRSPQAQLGSPDSIAHIPHSSRLSLEHSPRPSRSVVPSPVTPVSARIHESERRSAQDQGFSFFTDTKKQEEQMKRPGGSGMSGSYGLMPRPSLFVANPDHKTAPSDDS